jgi:hypothetical protein
MFKAICLALVYLIGMAAVLTLKPSTTESVAPMVAAVGPDTAAPAAGRTDERDDGVVSVNTLAKADKLTVAAFTEDEKKIVPVEEIKIEPTVKAVDVPSKSETKRAREVTSWHWRAGSKKIERH